MQNTTETVHLLWTGGWDSTYRLVQLLWQGRQVQPHYIIDPGRPSSGHELRAMEAIRQQIDNQADQLPGTLLATEISEKAAAVQNPEIHDAYNAIIKETYIGDQYMWLADYCKTRNLAAMEIGVVENPFILRAMKLGRYPYTAIFGRFAFPILCTSKLKMKEWAEATGTLPILALTWFCHKPTPDGEPCGRCHPCELTIAAGLGFRLPLRSRIRYHLRVIPRLRAFVKTFPGFYYRLYSLKHNNLKHNK